MQHNMALKQILRYLSGTWSHSIVYKAQPQHQNLYGYADAAYGNADNKKSTTEYVFLVADGAITWSSKKQIATVLSSIEAEYVALSESACEACWLRNLYNELGLLPKELPTLVLGDNEGAITMTKNPQFHKRSKHIEIHWHWVWDLVQEGMINIESIQDPEQTTDVLTKALPHPKHKKHTEDMGLAPIWGGVLRSDK